MVPHAQCTKHTPAPLVIKNFKNSSGVGGYFCAWEGGGAGFKSLGDGRGGVGETTELAEKMVQ